MPARKEIWTEVGLNLVVRGIWSGFFVCMGIVAGGVHRSPIAITILIVGTIVALLLALTFEYRRAQIRLRRRCVHS